MVIATDTGPLRSAPIDCLKTKAVGVPPPTARRNPPPRTTKETDVIKNDTHVQQHNQPEDVLDRSRAGSD